MMKLVIKGNGMALEVDDNDLLMYKYKDNPPEYFVVKMIFGVPHLIHDKDETVWPPLAYFDEGSLTILAKRQVLDGELDINEDK